MSAVNSDSDSHVLSWKAWSAQKKLVWRGVLTLLVLLAVVVGFSHFLDWQEQRPGFPFDDPLLGLFSPVDVSYFTFPITYGAIVLGLWLKRKEPLTLFSIFRSYTLLLLLRTITLLMVPLEAPAEIIPLADPFLDTLIYSDVNLRDLFFSGHVATVFLVALHFTSKRWRIVFLIATLVVGALVLAQHVHYSIDVLAAPAFAWLAWKLEKIGPRASSKGNAGLN